MCAKGIAKNWVYSGGQNGTILVHWDHAGEWSQVDGVFSSLLLYAKGADLQKTDEEQKGPKP